MRSFLITILSLVTAAANGTVGTTVTTDAEWRQKIIGTWVPDPSDRNARPGIGTYLGDGALIFDAYETKKCEKRKWRAIAQWRIVNGRLLIKVESVNGNPSSVETNDRIVSISPKRMVLENGKGTMQYRIKSTKCVPESEI